LARVYNMSMVVDLWTIPSVQLVSRETRVGSNPSTDKKINPGKRVTLKDRYYEERRACEAF
jgi:hypothetical protein